MLSWIIFVNEYIYEKLPLPGLRFPIRRCPLDIVLGATNQ